MSDFSRDWRLSSNVQHQRPEALRTAWLDETALAPDDWRMQQGLSPISEATREAVFRRMANERPMQQTGESWFGERRLPPLRALGVDPAQQVASAQRYPDRGDPSFREQNTLALLGQQIGGALSGQPAPASAPTFWDTMQQTGGALGASRLEGLGWIWR